LTTSFQPYEEGDASLLGKWVHQPCTAAIRRENIWSFEFGQGQVLNINAIWRIIADGRIALCSEDDGQQFGLPAPVNAEARARSLIIGRKIEAFAVDPETADLSIALESAIRIQVLSDSSGYEAWQATIREGATRYDLVAQGHGRLVVFKTLG
jgi:hypothetical protein